MFVVQGDLVETTNFVGDSAETNCFFGCLAFRETSGLQKSHGNPFVGDIVGHILLECPSQAEGLLKPHHPQATARAPNVEAQKWRERGG